MISLNINFIESVIMIKRLKRIDCTWQLVDSPDVDAFLADIERVCRSHGLSIVHEDTQGGFEIEDFSESAMDWLHAAADVRKVE